MNRRSFLKAAIGAAAVTAAVDGASAEGEAKVVDESAKLSPAAPCGLYCGICPDYKAGTCHGCRCKCGKCSGTGYASVCDIYKCVTSKGLKTCSGCADMPCTRVIQFTADPVWRTHLQCIENLRRQKKIGIDAWIKEQEAYWKDEKRLKRWNNLGKECERKANEERAGS